LRETNRFQKYVQGRRSKTGNRRGEVREERKMTRKQSGWNGKNREGGYGTEVEKGKCRR